MTTAPTLPAVPARRDRIGCAAWLSIESQPTGQIDILKCDEPTDHSGYHRTAFGAMRVTWPSTWRVR